ncbi:DUF1115 domain protein [Aspergillus campestris IBT 28561]|uniref:DUF1115 domain protein n=1 Tax=Aspergillus campestris (strain IBT 28561) TaxID=1392248 RepID=A0A2I1CSZ5_ASPC2|nr:DUF1115 domain protein [Aspergillus campestris IBT 28561]PKY00752.1 DUF1115 domain protein [Aspergillus campestris IBT 28561]
MASILPPDIMALQLSTIDLLTAMFPTPGELDIPTSTTDCIDRLRNWCEDPSSAPPDTPARLDLAVRLPIPSSDQIIQVNIIVPLQHTSSETELDEPPPLSYTLRQPEWLSRAELASISADMPTDDILSAFQYIQDTACAHLTSSSSSTNPTSNPNQPNQPIIRAWFYFPSLSTREKRDDLVRTAPSYSLTGFVLAGKPGVLCLEGESARIDAYMKYIKTHSWGDIPSHQKKVSERFRQTEAVERVFADMQEITDSLGERSGQRANRGDMQALEAWLGARGLGRRLRG